MSKDLEFFVGICPVTCTSLNITVNKYIGTSTFLTNQFPTLLCKIFRQHHRHIYKLPALAFYSKNSYVKNDSSNALQAVNDPPTQGKTSGIDIQKFTQ